MMLRTLQSRLHSLSKAQGRLRSLSESISPANGRCSGGVAQPANSWIGTNIGFAYSSTSRAAEIFQNHVGVSSNKNSLSGVRNFSTEDLAVKKCIPCSSKELKPMTEEEANKLTPKVPGWNLVNEAGAFKLQRTWKVKNFLKGLEFFQLVAGVAEAEGHHPDLHLLDWNKVQIDVWTHAQGGLTENDFIVAAKIDALDFQHLLSKKVAK